MNKNNMKQNFNNQLKKDLMALKETKFSLPLQSVSKLSTIVSHLSFFLDIISQSYLTTALLQTRFKHTLLD